MAAYQLSPLLQIEILIHTTDEGDRLQSRSESPLSGLGRHCPGQGMRMSAPGMPLILRGVASPAGLAGNKLARREAGQREDQQDSQSFNLPDEPSGVLDLAAVDSGALLNDAAESG